MRHAEKPGLMSQAYEVAQERMELILHDKRSNGYTTLVDPCDTSPAAACTPLTGYTVSSTITTVAVGAESSFKTIEVSVSGPNDANATLTSQVAEY